MLYWNRYKISHRSATDLVTAPLRGYLLRGYLGMLGLMMTTVVATVLLSAQLAQSAIPFPPPPDLPEPSPQVTATMVDNLGSSIYSERQQASSILQTGGIEVVRLLEKKLSKPNDEVAMRAYAVIHKIYFRRMQLSMDAETDQIEIILWKQLDKGTPEIRSRIARFGLNEGKYADLISQNALRRLRLKGAVLRRSRFDISQQEIIMRPGGGGFVERTIPASQKMDIILNDQWNGKIADIRFFRRLPKSFLSKVYLLSNSSITEKEKTELQAILPRGVLEFRGAAVLGVKGTNAPAEAAMIESVIPNSAADRAGIMAGDAVIQMGKDKITSFNDLIKVVGKYNPGNKAEVTIIRNQRIQKLLVTFAPW